MFRMSSNSETDPTWGSPSSAKPQIRRPKNVKPQASTEARKVPLFLSWTLGKPREKPQRNMKHVFFMEIT